MKESIDINDEFAKISNFLAMTETGDREIARQYLLEANWDETLAVNNFYNKIKDNINNNKNITNTNENPNNDSDNPGFFTYYILEPLKNLFSSCYRPREVDLDEEYKIFHFLPNVIDDFDKFNRIIKKHIGIIIFYNGRNIQFLNKIISQICRNSTLMNLLKQNCAIFPLLASIEKSIQIQSMVTSRNLVYPSFVFCHNNTDKNDLDESSVKSILESETITIELFHNKLIDALELINKNIKKILGPDSNYNILTDAEILEKQKNDMMALENQALKSQEEEKVEEEKLKEIDIRAEKAKNEIGDEPNAGNEDSTTICFRYPDGEKRIERRFLKSDKIRKLYDYVTSLGREIYTEEGNNTFSLYQPFPPKKYDNMENTLEKEGLFPNAIIQIREE